MHTAKIRRFLSIHKGLLAVLAVCYVPWLFLMYQVDAATAVYGVCICGSAVLALLALYERLTYNPKEI